MYTTWALGGCVAKRSGLPVLFVIDWALNGNRNNVIYINVKFLSQADKVGIICYS